MKDAGNFDHRWVIACHGGAGSRPASACRREVTRVRRALWEALEAGAAVLRSGGAALDAVQVATRVMEDSRVLNAGGGAVLNRDGRAELDAALMNGRDRAVGAVAAVRTVKNPIDLARAVMDVGPHVLIVGDGAERFAREHGFDVVPSDHFATPRRRRELAEVKKSQGEIAGSDITDHTDFTGTVGAVALDRHGDLAAATSTGGVTNKHPGRVGDSPLAGAGTYAENGVCAVSATGTGEFFIRATAAAAVAARVKYAGQPILRAAGGVLGEVGALGGNGGMIAVDAGGRIAMPYSSETMLRGVIGAFRPLKVYL